MEQKQGAEPTFEQAMERLEQIVRQLESGSGALEEMLTLYEEGMRLHEFCIKQLDAYEGKLQKLSIRRTAEGL